MEQLINRFETSKYLTPVVWGLVLLLLVFEMLLLSKLI